MTSIFENNLLHIQQDLECRSHSKAELLKYYIATRLANSLQVYYEELERSVSYLENRKAESVVSRL